MKYTNKFNLPSSLVDAITGKTYDRSKRDPYRLGVTTLINPPIQSILTVKYWNELEEDISEHLFRIGGSAYHYVLSQMESENRLIEEKFIEELNGVTIVGKLDLYDKLTKAIEDWKVTSVWSAKFGKSSDYEAQINCYAWLLGKKGIVVEKGYINQILRDWRKNERQRFDDYPPIPFNRKEIKIWLPEEQQKYVEERVEIYKTELALPEDELTVCTSEERWERQTTYAVMKNKNKKASRVLETATLAEEWKSNQNAKDSWVIVERKGTCLKCDDYCSVAPFCRFNKERFKNSFTKL